MKKTNKHGAASLMETQMKNTEIRLKTCLETFKKIDPHKPRVILDKMKRNQE